MDGLISGEGLKPGGELKSGILRYSYILPYGEQAARPINPISHLVSVTPQNVITFHAKFNKNW